MSVNEKLMTVLYYSPNTEYTSINKLYNKLKHRGISYDEVKDFINKQEAHQLFKKPKHIKYYFPIVAKYKHEILQADLIDISDLASANENYKYILVCIDVFSRFVYAIPLKSKDTQTIIKSMEDIIELTHPKIINCDKGSEFISNTFKTLMKNNNIEIKYVEVGDHKKLGVIDRFVRTLREKINKYLVMHNTTKYINVLPSIIHSYNNSYHSGIKHTPSEVQDTDEEIIKLTNRKYNKAKEEETIFNIGDNVRYIINRKAFEKHTLPKWSKSIHSIISKTQHTYTLDNDKTFKYYELQKVVDVQHLDIPLTEPTREQLRKQITSKRRFKKEGLSN